MSDSDQPLGLALSDQLGLPAQLRTARDSLRRHDATMHDAPGGTSLYAEAADEIERLRAALKIANDQAERFERGWYLRGDALEKLQQWARAYPLTVFPEPDFKRAHELLTTGGMTLDGISASNMRHVITQTVEIVEAGLRA